MSENSDNRGKFIKGAAVLAAAGLFTKILGAVFRIPLTGLIGADGLSYYNVAYAVYSALVVMSTAGLPIAISKMVSEHIAKKEYRYAHKIFRVSLVVMLIIGVISFIPTFFGADLISEFVKNPKAAPGLRAIAPALVFVPLFSSFRGYFNGRQNMVPTHSRYSSPHRSVCFTRWRRSCLLNWLFCPAVRLPSSRWPTA